MTNDAVQLYLASSSPRRQALLAQLGVEFQVIKAPIDETPRRREVPLAYVERMALEKARAGQQMVAEQALATHLPVMGSDTSVVLGNNILGKPRDQAHAAQMLSELSGRTHQVITSVALLQGETQWLETSISNVRFRMLSPNEIDAYWASGEPQDKAGAYGIQGVAASFVEHLSGSYSGVMGLPLYETTVLLKQVGIPVLDNG